MDSLSRGAFETAERGPCSWCLILPGGYLFHECLGINWELIIGAAVREELIENGRSGKFIFIFQWIIIVTVIVEVCNTCHLF